MSHASMLKTQQFCLSIRHLLGYPLYKPVNDCTAFASGGPVDIGKAMDLARLAEQSRKDFVYTAWNDLADRDPATIAVALRETDGIEMLDRCFLWAANDDAPLVIVSTRADVHIVMGARGFLERHPGRPAKALAAGKALAARRVRATVKLMGSELLDSNVVVPAGGEWRDQPPVRRETVVRFG